MPALTEPYEVKYKQSLMVAYPVAADTTLYKGALVGLNSNGYAVPMNHATASLRFVGIAEETVKNTGGNGEALVRVVKAGSGVYQVSPLTGQADIGKDVYAVTDHEVQLNATGLTNAYVVGTAIGIEMTSRGATGLRVRIDNHTK
ncbi:MAG: hypothetical protein K6T17_06445 [Fimbriimonadales bacterium]|nr:hypothetical protein [Fimbriimonadales bacterium]